MVSHGRFGDPGAAHLNAFGRKEPRNHCQQVLHPEGHVSAASMASARLTDETPSQEGALLRQPSTGVGAPEGPIAPKTRFLERTKGHRAETDEDHHANVSAKPPLDGTPTSLPWERCSSGRGRRSGQPAPEASAEGNGKKAADREHAEDHLPGSPGRPASAGMVGNALIATRNGRFGVWPGASAHRRSDEQRSKRDESKPSIEESPWKHRAACGRTRQRDATDLTVEQSPEVERPITAHPPGPLR